MEKKTCKRCGQQLPIEAFPPNGSGTYRPECRPCHQAQRRHLYQLDAAKVKARVQKYRDKNPDKVKETGRRYHLANREIRIAQASIYYCTIYRPANKERIANQQRAWEQNNPDKLLLKRLRRRTRLWARPIDFGPKDWQRCFGAFAGRCAYCGAKATTGDHFIPLSDEACPGTVPANILPACGSCNFSKGPRNAEQWLRRRVGEEEANRRLIAIRAYLLSVS